SPHPTVDHITVEMKNFADTVDAQVKIFNVLGQEVMSEVAEFSPSVTNSFNVNNLPPGTYFLNIQSGGQSKTKQFVKDKN
ncbi:MAG: T9SS type A sorting domain-containing protein, partial [Patescibacteria group bacterium]